MFGEPIGDPRRPVEDECLHTRFFHPQAERLVTEFPKDGVLTLDPHAQGVTRNDKGERVSLVPVS